jgi:hypothetical protein
MAGWLPAGGSLSWLAALWRLNQEGTYIGTRQVFKPSALSTLTPSLNLKVLPNMDEIVRGLLFVGKT